MDIALKHDEDMSRFLGSVPNFQGHSRDKYMYCKHV